MVQPGVVQASEVDSAAETTAKTENLSVKIFTKLLYTLGMI